MDPAQIISTVVVSIIAASGAFLAARASAKAQMTNVSTSSRVEMEKEAYERARKLDTETINRQDSELEELHNNQDALREDMRKVHRENERLYGENRIILEDNARLRTELVGVRQRLVRLERGLHPDETGRIRERETDTNPMLPGTGTRTDPMMREILDNG